MLMDDMAIAKGEPSQVASLKTLKTEVYELANVATTQQLKVLRPEWRSLDLRRKANWQLIHTQLQEPSGDFEAWLANPPEEYRELFGEIADVTTAYGNSIAEGKLLSAELQLAAEELEELSSDYSSEASALKQQEQAARKQAKARRLN